MKRIGTIDRERDLILATLNQCGGSRAQVCKALGISHHSLNKKLDDYAAQGFTVPPSPKGWVVREAAKTARKKARGLGLKPRHKRRKPARMLERFSNRAGQSMQKKGRPTERP